MTEDEIVGCHHQLDGCKFEEGLGVVDGQGGLSCCSPWGHKQFDTTERLNCTDKAYFLRKMKVIVCSFSLIQEGKLSPTPTILGI